MKDATLSRIDRVIGISIGAAWLVYMVVSVAGFETYGDNVKVGDVISPSHTKLCSFSTHAALSNRR